MQVEVKAPTRVLVVDDQRMLAESMVRALDAEEDIEVIGVAGTSAEAREQVRRHHPDVVVLDYYLPDGTGADVARSVKASHPEIEIVIITGDGESEEMLLAIDAGCLGLVGKDRPVGELIDAVRSAMAGEPALPFDALRRLVGRDRRDLGGASASSPLTPRELTVLQGMAAGQSNQVIGGNLFISVNTVRNNIQNIL